MKFASGDKLIEIDGMGNPISSSVWTFKQYEEERIVLEEFIEKDGDIYRHTFHAPFFRKLTKLEKALR